MTNVLRTLASFVVRPGTPEPDQGLWRHVLLRPRIFSTISFFAQLLDVRRTRQIADTYAVDDEHHRRVQDYNAGVTLKKNFSRTRRTESLLRVCLLPSHDVRDDNLLLIGPRTIAELVLAWLHGYRWCNLTGIDLYSTNSKIKIMNMEDMTFPDETFDAVLMAHTFSYAENPESCLRECARILKPGGRLVFNHTYSPLDNAFPGNHVRGVDVCSMMRKLPLRLYYYDARDKTNSLGHVQSTHLFGLMKIKSGSIPLDRIDWIADAPQPGSAA